LNLKPEHRDEIDLNLTPLIDVVFLLTFEKTAKLKVDLPEASAKASQVETKKIVVGVDAQGNYYVNDRQLVNTQIKTLKLAMLKLSKGDKKMPIILRADAKTPHQSVVRVMDAASQVGLTRLSILTLEARESP